MHPLLVKKKALGYVELVEKPVTLKGSNALEMMSLIWRARKVAKIAISRWMSQPRAYIDYEIHALVDAYHLGPSVELKAREMIPERVRKSGIPGAATV